MALIKLKNMGNLITSYRGVGVYRDEDDNISVVKGEGCGSLSCAIMQAELICGSKIVFLSSEEVRWLEGVEDQIEQGRL